MTKRNVTSPIVIDNARIGFRNFTGKEGKYNRAGSRNFCVFLESDMGKTLMDDGWNIRWLQPRDSNEDEQACLQVAVSFTKIPPKIVLITGRGKTVLDEESVSLLDWAEISYVDLIVRPYNWDVNGKQGVKAYVKSMYITLAEDKFESKYYDVPDSADNSMCDGCRSVGGPCDKCRSRDVDNTF